MSTEQKSKTKPPVVLLYQCTAINAVEIEAGFVTGKTSVLLTPMSFSASGGGLQENHEQVAN